MASRKRRDRLGENADSCLLRCHIASVGPCLSAGEGCASCRSQSSRVGCQRGLQACALRMTELFIYAYAAPFALTIEARAEFAGSARGLLSALANCSACWLSEGTAVSG